MIIRGKAGKRAGLLLGALLLAGCGGGSGGGGGSANNGNGGSNGSNGVEQSYGALTTRVVGTAQPPAVFYGSGGAVTGIAGASITSLIQNRTITAPNLDPNTRIAYYASDSTGFYQLFTVPFGGGTPTQVTTGNLSKYSPTWSPDGAKLAYYAFDSAGYLQLFTISSGGGTPTKITTSTQHKYYPAWSPDGAKIAYNAADSTGYTQLFTVPAGGGTATQITTGSLDKYSPAWSPDGTKLVYYALDSGGYYQLFTVPASGGTPTQVTAGSLSKYYPAWSPDGTKLAYTANDSASINQLFTVPAGGGTATQVTTGSLDKYSPAWSPDGTALAYNAPDSAGHSQLFTISFYTNSTATQVTTGNQDISHPVWSGFLTSPKPVTLIGSGGLLGASAAGFLFAQSGDDVRSVLTFDTGAATTDSRAGARVAALTAPDAVSPTNLLFSITATDSLSSLKFVNYDSESAPGKVTAPALPTGTTGVLVSFNAVTGKVTTVLPYAANRSAGSIGASNTVQVSHQGTALALHGRFLAVYDGAGENRAPAQGASTVLLDAQTGQITSVQ